MYQAISSGDLLCGVLVAIAWREICRNRPQGPRLCGEVQNLRAEIDLPFLQGLWPQRTMYRSLCQFTFCAPVMAGHFAPICYLVSIVTYNWTCRTTRRKPVGVGRKKGLEIDLAETNRGTFELGHTVKRCEELLATLHELLLAEKVDVKSLEKLHGRLVWFSAYVFGRELNAAVRVISKYARIKAKSINKPDDLNRALKFLSEELVRARPVQVSISHLQHPLCFHRRSVWAHV